MMIILYIYTDGENDESKGHRGFAGVFQWFFSGLYVQGFWASNKLGRPLVGVPRIGL